MQDQHSAVPDLLEDLEQASTDPVAAWVPEVHAFFVNAPGALNIQSQETSGDLARAVRARLFGATQSQRAAGASLFRRVRRRQRTSTTTAVTRPTRARTRPRERRDGSRRHSTRGGTDDSDHHQDDEPAEPTPPDGRRFCAVNWCDTDITGKRSNRKYCDEHNNVRARVATHRAKQLPASKIDFEGSSIWALQTRAKAGCTCNGHHVLDPWDGNCLKCGRPWRDDVAPYYLAIWERKKRAPSPIPSALATVQSRAVVA